jgi:hypothetical protein
MSAQIVAALDRYRDLRDEHTEKMFLSVYGSPVLQALVGLNAADGAPRGAGAEDGRGRRDRGHHPQPVVHTAVRK